MSELKLTVEECEKLLEAVRKAATAEGVFEIDGIISKLQQPSVTERKRVLEAEINRLVTGFQDATGLTVDGIDRKTGQQPDGNWITDKQFTVTAVLT